MFFRRNKTTSTPTQYRSETRLVRQFTVVENLEKLVCGAHWNPDASISCLAGMSLGGLRAGAMFTNEKLNEQAIGLTTLTQKTLPLLIHVRDFSSGNNQTLRLPFFRFFAGNCQQSADFALLGRKLAELSLLPVMVIHAGTDGSYEAPSKELVEQFLGLAADSIPSPTPSQQFLFGKNRRRLPEFWNPDLPTTNGLAVPPVLRDRQWAAKQTFFSAHVPGLLRAILDEFFELTGRRYEAAEFGQRPVQHLVVTTEAFPTELQGHAPIVKINFMTPELHQELSAKTLSFIDRNHSRALSTALNLPGYSLVHYGPILARTVQAALSLNAERPMDIAGARFMFAAPLNPKEEIYNQQIQDLYSLPQIPEVEQQRTAVHLETPAALRRTPVVEEPLANLHDFWAQNGKFLASGQLDQVVATPALATGVLPAGSGMLLHPHQESFAVRVVECSDFISTLVARMGQENFETSQLESSARTLSKLLKQEVGTGGTFLEAIESTFAKHLAQSASKEVLAKELANARYFLPKDCQILDGAIRIEDRSIEHKAFFDLLPNTAQRFLEKPENILLDKDAFQSFVRTENNASQSINQLFSAVARVAAREKSKILLGRVESAQKGLEQHIRQRLSVSLSGDLGKVLQSMSSDDLTLADLAQRLDRTQAPVDRQWLLHVNGLQNSLVALQDAYARGCGGQGRASHGIISQNAVGVYPWSPVTVPWAQNGNGEGVELALGVWEAHMAKIIPDMVCLRKVELELGNRYNPRIHDAFFDDFTWKQLTPEELALCPPLVITGSDTDFYRHAGSMAELFRTGAPIKLLVCDTLHAHPASLLQQLVAHDIEVLQSALCEEAHLIAGMDSVFRSPHPAIIQVLSPSTPEYLEFSKRAVDAGLYPLFSGRNGSFAESLHFHEKTWLSAGNKTDMTLADLLIQDPTFASEFSKLGTVSGTAVADYLALDEEDRLQTVPVVMNGMSWKVSTRMLGRILELDRMKTFLLQISGKSCPVVNVEEIRNQARAEMVDTVARSLVELARRDA